MVRSALAETTKVASLENAAVQIQPACALARVISGLWSVGEVGAVVRAVGLALLMSARFQTQSEPPRSPETRRVPSVLQARLMTGSVCPSRLWTMCPVDRSHMWMVQP